jgi:CheY-like chemotaxis protein
MRPICRLLLVEPDPFSGRVQARVLTRLGYAVHLVHTRAAALKAVRATGYDVGVIDLFLRGGGPELARALARRVPRLLLSVGPALGQAAVLHAAAGFPVHRKLALTRALRPSRPARQRRLSGR